MNFVRCRLRIVANCVLALRAFIARSDTDQNQHDNKVPRKRLWSLLKREPVMLNIIEKADNLFQSYKIDELYKFLIEHKDVCNEEIQWRLARVTHEYAQHHKDPVKRQKSMLEAFSYAEKALDLNPNIPHCHRWYAALLYFTTESIGIKNKIQTAYKVREHFDKALEMDPDDTISVHSIGYWCYAFADRPWYQRKIASTIFMSMPETTFEEALEWFLKAEKMENVMCTNSVMTAKTYLRLKDKEKAVEYLKKAVEMKVVAPTDKASQKEAREMLKSMGYSHYLKNVKEEH